MKRTNTINTDNDIDRQTTNRIIDGYAKLIRQRVKAGYHPYLATFMFARLRGSRAAVIGQMRTEIERVFSTFLTRIVRRPCRRDRLDYYPF